MNLTNNFVTAFQTVNKSKDESKPAFHSLTIDFLSAQKMNISIEFHPKHTFMFAITISRK